jgi:hypothetical protein
MLPNSFDRFAVENPDFLCKAEVRTDFITAIALHRHGGGRAGRENDGN